MQKRGKGIKKLWTSQEDSILSIHWGRKNGREISLVLGGTRTPSAVRARARDLGLPLKTPSRPWTISDINRFREVYPIVGGACAKSFGRTLLSTRKMAQFLKVKVNRLGGKPHNLKGNVLPSGIKVIECLGSDKSRGNMWLFECHCGNLGRASASRLYRGEARSCGCLNLKLRPGPYFDARRSKNRGAWKYNRVKHQSERLKEIQRSHDLYPYEVPDIKF